ncbi:hypothetical protein A3F66_02395 [candidate division TM6 bacterium RIFCSPHIGHO2_12_FULL_32_22]|nr:MAG: hypothetical protein A3F66_02395 [candidate division TM6 bacterium RIFCSPHIGHO2_12_FULL_32_22]
MNIFNKLVFDVNLRQLSFFYSIVNLLHKRTLEIKKVITCLINHFLRSMKNLIKDACSSEISELRRGQHLLREEMTGLSSAMGQE